MPRRYFQPDAHIPRRAALTALDFRGQANKPPIASAAKAAKTKARFFKSVLSEYWKTVIESRRARLISLNDSDQHPISYGVTFQAVSLDGSDQ
jgi:hypothetical protein